MRGLSGWSPADLAAVVSAGGACPAGRRQTLPLWCPQGGLGGFGRLPTLPLVCFVAPIPPPALAERSSPPGKGEIFSFLMQGAPPLASPRPSRKLHGLNLRCRCPLGGLVRLVAGRPCRCGVRRGAWRFWSPPYPAVSFISCPLSPQPPSPVGKGELFTLFRRGLRPRHPCIRPFAALIVPAMRAPRARSLRFAAKPTGSGSLWAVPSAKERGDRGRWNYPSQATAAFEMVLSPGAGIASAAQGQAPPLSTTAAGRASAAGGLMQGCRGRSPRRNKLLVSPFPGGEGGRGDGGKK